MKEKSPTKKIALSRRRFLRAATAGGVGALGMAVVSQYGGLATLVATTGMPVQSLAFSASATVDIGPGGVPPRRRAFGAHAAKHKASGGRKA